jgi:hypothetical protein
MERKMSNRTNVAVVMTAALVGSGLLLGACATTPDDTASTDEQLVTLTDRSDVDGQIDLLANGPSPFSTRSFIATCRLPIHFTINTATGATVYADSVGCQRFDGSFGGFTSWSGNCFGDVSNCNGRIVCQSHCP